MAAAIRTLWSAVGTLICYDITMHSLRTKTILVNTAGTLFYLSCLVQWLWATLPYLPGVVHFLNSLQQPTTPQDAITLPTLSTVSNAPPSWVLLLFGAIMTAAVIGATIYALIKIPTGVGKVGAKMTRSASSKIVPLVVRSKPITKKKRRQLTARIVIDIKLALCVLPICVTALSFLVETDLYYDITMLVAAVLGVMTIIVLCIQTALIKLLHVPSEKAW